MHDFDVRTKVAATEREVKPCLQPVASEPELARLVRFKGKLLWAIRAFLHQRGALEVPMPMLQPTREGAPVNQWSTTAPDGSSRWYLRHSMEDNLRRVCAAHPRVFEIGKAIRADAPSARHAHEFLLLELVMRETPFANGIDLIREMLVDAVAPVAEDEYGRGAMLRTIEVRRWDDVFRESTGLPRENERFIQGCQSWLSARGVLPRAPYTRDWEVLEDIMRHAIEPACVAPTIITHFPKELQHVCTVGDPEGRAQRLTVIVNGVEVGDGGLKLAGAAEYRRIYESNPSRAFTATTRSC